MSGCCVIETTWHNVYAWEGKNIHELDKLEKGSQVEIAGRLKNQRYTTANGEDSYSTEILAHTIDLITVPLKKEE